MAKYLDPTVKDDLYYQDATLTVKNLSAGNVTNSGLTSGRVVFATTGGQLTDDADLTFATDTLSATNVTSSGTVQGAIVKDTGLTSGRVTFATTGGQLTDDSDLTFATDTLTATNIQVTTQSRHGDTGTNYTNFDNTGHQTMAGTAKPWEDLRIEPVARTTGANAPTFERYIRDSGASTIGCFLYTFDDAAAGSEKEVFFNMQMPHAWDGGAISIHVHWIPNMSDTTATPRWGLEYTWADIDTVFPYAVIVYATGNTAGSANLTQNKHYITEFADLTPTASQDGISSVLIGRLFRDSANAADTFDAAGNKCGLLYIDAHYQVNSLGSTDEYTK